MMTLDRLAVTETMLTVALKSWVVMAVRYFAMSPQGSSRCRR